MAEYIKKKDVIELCEYMADINFDAYSVIRQNIIYMPVADVVKVVRCKDCKHRIDDEDFQCGHICLKRRANGGRFCEDNDFCSYGERK